MKIIAHRGSSHGAPENTVAAIRLAWEQKADGVEIDVHLSRDNHIMVIHDPTTRRTARRRATVADLSADELQQLDAGSWKARRWAGERIPRLEEVLSLLPRGKELLIEVKCGRGFIPAFVGLHDRLGRTAQQIVIIGFDFPTMRLVKKRFPALRVLWVTGLQRRSNWESPTGPLQQLIKQVQAAGLDGLDLDARGPITASVVDRLHQANLEVYVWTVDAPSQARRFARLGIDGLAMIFMG